MVMTHGVQRVGVAGGALYKNVTAPEEGAGYDRDGCR
jgi:hypothetical protein